MATLRPGVTIGPYRVERLFPEHSGGFAQVALARRQLSTGKGEYVIIKLAKTSGGDDTFSRSLSNEVETLRRLKHPGIVRIYPIQVDERHYSYMARATALKAQPWFFVMEYLAGGSVESLIKSKKALKPKLAIEIAQHVCMALDYIHTNGYAHLDIKTTNIMLRRPLHDHIPPEPVLIDFGAAQKDMRRAEVEAGALVYLPPERVLVMNGEKSPETVTDKKAVDMYAVGVTLYRMVTGELPFTGRRSRLTTAILRETPTRPIQFTANMKQYRELDELIMQLLDKRPEQRPTAQEVITKLDHIAPPPRFIASDTDSLSPFDTHSSRHSRRWKALALGLLLVAVLEGSALASFASAGHLPEFTTPFLQTVPPPLPTSTPTIVPATPSPTLPSSPSPFPSPTTVPVSTTDAPAPFIIATPTPH